MHATAPDFTATRALHTCLRCDERYPLALNPKIQTLIVLPIRSGNKENPGKV